MSRIVVLCEGDTEELVVQHFIAPQWKSEGLGSVGLKSINLDGKLDKAGKFASGYLDDKKVLAVFTLIDLQGMTKVAHQHEDSLETKIQRVRNWLHVIFQAPRFRRSWGHRHYRSIAFAPNWYRSSQSRADERGFPKPNQGSPRGYQR